MNEEMKMRFAKQFLAGLAFGMLALSAGAQVLDLDDKVGSGIINFNQYAGFNWNNFHANDTHAYTGAGAYRAAATSGATVIVNSFGNDSSLTKTGGGLFDFTSANMMAAWGNGLKVTITGWLSGASLYTQTITLNTTGPTLQSFEFSGIDRLTFHAFGGSDGRTHFTVDDMNFSPVAAVPEASTYAMLIAGLGMIGLVARRRKQA